MSKIFQYCKQEGETLALLLLRIRSEQSIPESVPLTYAGRLDPMAEGLVLVLVGDECKKKDAYLGMNKIYEYEVLFGVETDTCDILGLPIELVNNRSSVDENKIQEILKKLIGKITQTYPPYSSKTVNGIPLFQYAREGRLSEITLPVNEIEIYSHEFLGMRTITREELLSCILERITKVRGDFRQEEIIKAWCAVFEDSRATLPETFSIASFRISCSSGTYIRRIASDMGKILGVPALAWKIARTHIDGYSVGSSKGISS